MDLNIIGALDSYKSQINSDKKGTLILYDSDGNLNKLENNQFVYLTDNSISGLIKLTNINLDSSFNTNELAYVECEFPNNNIRFNEDDIKPAVLLNGTSKGVPSILTGQVVNFSVVLKVQEFSNKIIDEKIIDNAQIVSKIGETTNENESDRLLTFGVGDSKSKVATVAWTDLVEGPSVSSNNVDTVVNRVINNITDDASQAIKNSSLSKDDILITAKTQYKHPENHPYVPQVSEANKVLKTYNNAGKIDLRWDTDETGIPSGGTSGQLLAKSASGLEWINKELPVLNDNKDKFLRVNSTETNVEWVSISKELPDITSNNNKILRVNSSGTDIEWVSSNSVFNGLSSNTDDNKGKILIINQDGNPEWVDFIPSIKNDDTNKVLTVKSGTNKELEWSVIEATSVFNTINGYDSEDLSKNTGKTIIINESGEPELVDISDKLEEVSGTLESGNILTLVKDSTDTSGNGLKPSWEKFNVINGLNSIDGLASESVSVNDNGKVLIIDNGKIKWITIEQLPEHKAESNKGQVLAVKNDDENSNELEWVTINASSISKTIIGYDSNDLSNNLGKTITINASGQPELISVTDILEDVDGDKTAGYVLKLVSDESVNEVKASWQPINANNILNKIIGLQKTGDTAVDNAANSNKVLKVNSNGNFVWEKPASGLPDTTSASNGQVLQLVNNDDKLIPTWVNITKSSGLPDYSSASDGQILTLVDNEGTLNPQWVTNNSSNNSNLTNKLINVSLVFNYDRSTGTINESTLTGKPDGWSINVEPNISQLTIAHNNNTNIVCIDCKVFMWSDTTFKLKSTTDKVFNNDVTEIMKTSDETLRFAMKNTLTYLNNELSSNSVTLTQLSLASYDKIFVYLAFAPIYDR